MIVSKNPKESSQKLGQESNSDSARDALFAAPQERADFVFDDKVANVFEDMINRSVPGYATILSMISVLANRYCLPGTRAYDLGCSLGGATLAMDTAIDHNDYEIVAVDNSSAMVGKLKAELTARANQTGVISLHCDDIQNIEISNASVVVLNFTLQFIQQSDRDEILQKIYKGMTKGGILILSEKIEFPDENLNALFIERYHEFKERMGYSKMEISQKRTALENVLIPETLDCHKSRILNSGFSSVDVWFQCFNFASLVAFK